MTVAGGINVTVSEMRKHLAGILSKLKGGDRITYKLTINPHKGGK
jgi:hypothetical protein